jgi:hypothetical protein
MRHLLVIAFLFIASMAVGQSTYQCGEKTKAGTSCVRKVDKQGAKCYQHGGKTHAETASVVKTAPCGAPTKAGTPCKNPVKGGGRCHLHKS